MSNSLNLFHPLIRQWFTDHFDAPTDVQQQAWPVIARGDHALITAPTGSGKTLTAFLWALHQLFTGAWSTGSTRVLYVSPLKALNNDIERNLLGPLEEVTTLFEKSGEAFPTIRVATRSGDTPPGERQKMLRRPPEILITTPESLNLLLTSPKARDILIGIQTVIMDEIHAVAGSKRGVHFITAVERLLLLNDSFQRVALSATVNPLTKVAEFIGGYDLDTTSGEATYSKRRVTIVQSRQPKAISLEVRYPPVRANAPDDGGRWPALTEALKSIIEANKSTLIFTNTRRHCERISLYLNQDEEELIAYAHHGSLSREVRAVVERRLKDGELAAIVATSSLELGIDVGDLDEVAMIQTPNGISATLQRVGRAGHRVGETSRGVLFPLHARDVLEAAVMVHAVHERDLEPLKIITCPLDILAQILVSMTSVDEWDLDELYAFIRTSSPYQDLSRTQFDLVVQMLAGRYTDSRIRALQSLVSIDPEENIIRAKPAALRIIYTSGGTIPDRGLFNLRMKDSLSKIGQLDEEFVWERHLGEVFPLGTQYWKIQQITHNDVIVTPAADSPNVVPFWRADQFSRAYHFSERLGRFLEEANDRLGTQDFRDQLSEKHGLDTEASNSLIEFLKRQRESTNSELPHRHHVLIERCTDHRRGKDNTQYILHTLWGGSVNRPLSLALGQAWEDRTGEPIEVFADNDAVVLVAPHADDEIDCFGLLKGASIEGLLRRRMERTGLFGARFRENAARALLLPKQSFGKRMPLWMSRIRSKKLFDAVIEYEDFPILAETWRTCLQDEFDLATLRDLLGEIADGQIRITELRSSEPSPFAATVVWGQTNKYMYADDTPNQQTVSNLADSIMSDVVYKDALRPQLSPSLLDEYQQKLHRTHPGYSPRTARDLIDWTRERLLIPHIEFDEILEAIHRDHGEDIVKLRASVSKKLKQVNGGVILQETIDRFSLEPILASNDASSAHLEPTDEELEQWSAFLAEWLRFYGPTTQDDICQLLQMEPKTIAPLLESLVEARLLIHGALIKGDARNRYCDAENYEVLLRIARRENRPTLQALPIEKLPLFLATFHGIPNSEQLEIQDTLDQFLGAEFPVEMLEKEYLPARFHAYTTQQLDEALSPAQLSWIGTGKKKFQLAPIHALDAFIKPDQHTDDSLASLLPNPMGRYSFSELTDHTNLSSEKLSAKLWDAVWRGSVTNDSFQTLRKGIMSRFQSSSLNASTPSSARRGFKRWKATRPTDGFWHALPAPEQPVDLLDEVELIKDRARILFDRYGVLFRELLSHELPWFRWGAVFRALRLMELSGEIVGGHFFEGVPGLQFATRDGLKFLQADLPGDTIYWLNATDPVSPCGLGLDAMKGAFPNRLKTNHIVFHGSELVLTSRRLGKEITINVSSDSAHLSLYLDVFDHLLNRSFQPVAHIAIETINGESAVASEYAQAFRDRFEVHADRGKLTLWKR